MTNYDPIENRHWRGADGSEVLPLYLERPSRLGGVGIVLASYVVIAAVPLYLAAQIVRAVLT